MRKVSQKAIRVYKDLEFSARSIYRDEYCDKTQKWVVGHHNLDGDILFTRSLIKDLKQLDKEAQVKHAIDVKRGFIGKERLEMLAFVREVMTRSMDRLKAWNDEL